MHDEAKAGEFLLHVSRLSLVPRPSYRSIFECLQCAKTEGEVLVHFTM